MIGEPALWAGRARFSALNRSCYDVSGEEVQCLGAGHVAYALGDRARSRVRRPWR
jgi:hypothetical protein